jgi:hypothetical protein
MTIATAHTAIPTSLPIRRLPKKKVGTYLVINPSGEEFEINILVIDVSDMAVARVHMGSSWHTLLWRPEPISLMDRRPDRLNSKATALLNQPMTKLLKGPLPLAGPYPVQGNALMHKKTVLMPYVRIGDHIETDDARDRIERTVRGFGCVTWDGDDRILIFEHEEDILCAMIAVC